jgi:hypothetical protein
LKIYKAENYFINLLQAGLDSSNDIGLASPAKKNAATENCD